MKIHYRNSKLKKLAEDIPELKKKYWDQADKIIRVINMLEQIEKISDIPKWQSFRPHLLSGNTSDKLFSTDLKHPYRLLFVPKCEYDKDDWENTIKEIEIVEICIDTHDKKFRSSNY